MTKASKNVYIDRLNNIFDKWNNTYHRKVKMKPVNVNPSTYVEFNAESNEKDHKFKVADHVRTSKYNLFLQRVTL